MSGKLKIAIAAVAATIVALPTGVVLAQSLGAHGHPGAHRAGMATARVHPVAGRPGAAAGRLAKGSREGSGIALDFAETNRVSVPASRSSITVGPTPKGCETINGYYSVPGSKHTKVSSEGDSPAGGRFWRFYRNNRTGDTVSGVVYGTVCMRGAKLIH